MPRIRFFGHSSFEVGLDGVVSLIDPFFAETAGGMRREVPPAVSPDAIRRADCIFITHEHDDHCDRQALEGIVERTGAVVVAPKPALSRLGIPEGSRMDVRPGDRFSLGELDVEVVKAIHPNSACPVGFILRRGAAVYHAGDTYEFFEMNRIRCDCALLPVGGAGTMDTLGASKAIWQIRPKSVVPMHYDTFAKIRQGDISGWARSVDKSRVVVLRPGQEIVF